MNDRYAGNRKGFWRRVAFPLGLGAASVALTSAFFLLHREQPAETRQRAPVAGSAVAIAPKLATHLYFASRDGDGLVEDQIARSHGGSWSASRGGIVVAPGLCSPEPAASASPATSEAPAKPTEAPSAGAEDAHTEHVGVGFIGEQGQIQDFRAGQATPGVGRRH